MAEWVAFRLTVVTPLFSGADPDGAPGVGFGLTVGGVRGVLGFWLRALVGSRVGNDLTALLAAQREVFGGGERLSGVALRWHGAPPVPSTEPLPAWLKKSFLGKGNPMRPNLVYLLGPGLCNRKAFLVRPFYGVGVALDFAARPTGAGGALAWERFLAALWLVHHFGALGARGRRGFGQVAVTFPEGGAPEWWDAAPDLNEAGVPSTVARVVSDIPLSGAVAELPTFPRFGGYGDGPTVLMGESSGFAKDDAVGALDEVGSRWRTFRADQRNEQNGFTTEWRDVVQGPRTSDDFPLGVLGLPVGFGEKRPTVNLMRDDAPLRLASPLWLRVVTAGPGAWRIRTVSFVHALMPAGATVRVSDQSTPLNRLDPKGVALLHRAWVGFDGRSASPRRPGGALFPSGEAAEG